MGLQSPRMIRLWVCLVALTVVLCISCEREYPLKPELDTLTEIRVLLSAESKYYQLYGHYADLMTLGGANLISKQLAAGSVGDYKVRVEAAVSGFEITAEYAGASDFPHRSFYVDATNTIRSEFPPAIAGRASPPIK